VRLEYIEPEVKGQRPAARSEANAFTCEELTKRDIHSISNIERTRLKAFGIEIPAFTSVRRQILPGLLASCVFFFSYSRLDKPGVSEMVTVETRRRVGGNRLPLLEIALLAAVEAVLAGLDFFFALRSYSNPVLCRGVPVQIAVLDGSRPLREAARHRA
jgi:hypothetical protein